MVLYIIKNPADPEEIGHLIGTIHEPASLFPNKMRIFKAAVKRSKVHLNELCKTSFSTIFIALGLILFSKKGSKTPLKKLLTSADLKKLAEKESVPLKFLGKMTLTDFILVNIIDSDGGDTVDTVLEKTANEMFIKCKSLDTFKLLRSAMSKISVSTQNKMITLDELDKTIKTARETKRNLIKDYATNKNLLNSELVKQIPRELLEIRNVAWIPKIKKVLKKYKKVSIAVGAAHLLGEKGLVNLLQQDGFTVTKIPNLPKDIIKR